MSSYSITTYPKLPYMATKRISVPITVAPHGKVRASVLRGALDRIQHLPRSHVGASAEEDFLNARASVNFDDTVHSIRAQTAALLKRVHTPIPHAVRPLPISSYYKYIETPIPERINSDAYINIMLLSPNEQVLRNVVPMSHYPDTTQHRISIGRGRLACVSFAAGRVYPRRRLMIFDENNYRNVRNDVQYLSYYNKTRAEAAKQHPKITLDEEAKLREESVIKPAYPTHTHVPFQTPIKTEAQLSKPIKTTEPLYSDNAENVFQKEEEIDAWLTHQKKKKSKKDAENNAAQLNEELAAREERFEVDRIQPEVKSTPIKSEKDAKESAAEIAEQEKEPETAQESEQDLAEQLEVKEKVIENEAFSKEEEKELENEPMETSELTKEEEVSGRTKEATKEDENLKDISIEPVNQSELLIENEEQFKEKEQVNENEEKDNQIDQLNQEKEQEEPTKEEELVQENCEVTNENELRVDQPEAEEKQPENNVVVEDDIEPEEKEKLRDAEVESASVKEEAKLVEAEKPEAPSKPEDKAEETDIESVKEEVCEEKADEVTECSLKNDVADKSVSEVRKMSEDICSTLEHKDDGPKSDTEISDLEEDECAPPEKVSIKNYLNPAVDTNLDDSSLVDDVFEDDAPGAPGDNETQPEATTDEECEEDSE